MAEPLTKRTPLAEPLAERTPPAARAVLVTGATSGVGRWLAARLGERGATVLVHGRDAARVAAVAEEVRASGGAAEEYAADLSSLSEVARLAERVARRDRLDVLVNNAGVGAGSPGSGRRLSADGHELRWAVNYLAPVALTEPLVDLLCRSEPARIVNVGSVGQSEVDLSDPRMDRHYDGRLAYGRSKLALAAYTFDLADRLAGTGVTANCLHPATFMDTAMVREAGVSPWSSVEEGGRAVLRLVADPALTTVTGQFFDGETRSRAHPAAYDAAFRERLAAYTSKTLPGS